MKRQNRIKKIILSLILIVTTFFTAAAYPIVETYGGLMEVSAAADASSSFEDDEGEKGKDKTEVDTMPDGNVKDFVEDETVDEIEDGLAVEFLPEIAPTLEDSSTNSTIVYDYDELISALSEDNGFEIIYLGANIYANRNGIAIHPSKQNVVIDGCAPGAGMVRRTFLEYYDSINNPAETIHLTPENTTTNNITLQNIVVLGQHEEGVVFIPENISDVTVSYENVEYRGPQVVTNPRGLVQFVDCYFKMDSSNGIGSHYVATANHIELGGSTMITTTDPYTQVMDAVFLPTYYDPQIDILRDANLYIDVKGFFLNLHHNTVNINIHQKATFDIIGKSGFTPFGENIRNMFVAEGAFVSITQTEPQTFGTLRVEETLELSPGCHFMIIRTNTTGIPIIFPKNTGRAIFNNPERVILHGYGSNPILFEKKGYLKITTSSINAWNIGVNSSQTPTYIWNDLNNKLLDLEAHYSDGGVVEVTHSLGSNSAYTDPLTPLEFNFSNMGFFALGRIDLFVDTIYTTSTTITGLTERTDNQFKVRVSIDYEGLSTPLDPIEADSFGFFSFAINPETLNVKNHVTVTTNFNNLSKREVVFPQEISSGSLAFSVVPSAISFNTTRIAGVPTTITRSSGNFAFSVSDTRNYPNAWRVDARIAAPLTATLGDSKTVTLPNALVFVDAQGVKTPLSTVSLPIYHGNDLVAGDIDVIWGASEGILLDVAPGSIYSGVSYSTNIHWDLVDAP